MGRQHSKKAELSPRAFRGRPHFDRSKRRTLGVRERVLATADDLFFSEGIHETGINKLIDKAGVAKASFYSAFPSKDDLVEACLESRHKASLERLCKIEIRTASLESKIGDVFDLLLEAASKSTFRGCAFVVAAIEQHGRNLPASRWVRIHKVAVRDTLYGCLPPRESNQQGKLLNNFPSSMMAVWSLRRLGLGRVRFNGRA